jgi:hypothetical protein
MCCMDAHNLVADWRARADQLRRYAPEVANAWEDAATELEAFARRMESEGLTLSVAAAESGYSASHLSRLVGEGSLLNVGKPHAPRIRRGDLPRKPPKPRSDSVVDLAGDILRQRGIASPSDPRK